ncbi:MAG: ABC transporter ATP-binding protein [Nocardiaceae bacterium]|nr:ABC transporter ATP-binding protein [Nocardiaceae bacterium]
MANAIKIRGLVKRFGSLTAVDHLDLTVADRQVHGFLGPNGAGKTTTIRTLLGLYRADEGKIRVLGKDPARESAAINRRVSYVPGDVALWPNLTGQEVIDALAGLRGDRREDRERELIDRFALDPRKKIRAYSKGNRQKVALVAAFAAPTDLLVLDEPTSGLDPLMEQIFGECVDEAIRDGQSVLLSSHILGEVERLCSHVTIIKDGKQVESGALADLRHLAASTVTARTDGAVPLALKQALEGLGLHLDLSEGAGDRLSCAVPRQTVPKVLGLLADNAVADITCTPASLEDLFLRHYEVEPR